MFTRRHTALAVPAVFLLALVGCSAGGGASDPSSSTSPSDASGSDSAASTSTTACISNRDWTLDIPDMATQLGASLAGNGMNVTQSEGAGNHTIRFAETGEVSSSIDLSYTVTIVQDDLTLTLVQTHAGDGGGDWAWVGDTDTITFSNWDNGGYSVQNQFLLNGIASDSAMSIPNDTLAGTDMAAICSGSSLTTQVAASPFTQHWTTED